MQDDAGRETVTESVPEEAEAGGVTKACTGGGLHLEPDHRPVAALDEHVDLHTGAVPEVGESERLVDHGRLPDQLVHHEALQECPARSPPQPGGRHRAGSPPHRARCR